MKAMEEIGQIVKYNCSRVINNAVGSETSFCTGYPASGPLDGRESLTLFKMSARSLPLDGLDGRMQVALAKERCMCSDAYMGDVNLMEEGGGYCGMNGALWGYDLVRPLELEQQKPLYLQPQYNMPEAPVYSIDPLLDATQRLLGRRDAPRYPLLPGCFTAARTQWAQAIGPMWVWCVMGVAIPANRDEGSCYILQDSGIFGNESCNESDMLGFVRGVLRKATHAIALHGKDMNVPYQSIHIGYRYIFAEPGQMGCAMACAPSIGLARDAIPYGMVPEELQAISLLKWEEALGLQ